MGWGRHFIRSAAVLALVLALPASGHAFTTRVHIVLANEIRLALIQSGDGTIELRWSDHAVQIPQEDADAIINQPLAFRAGAVGPDNVVFPAMTDGSHGVEQDPYRQCELLYEAAITEVERAYALGCFLHGASDAIAHHYVNHFTGETFTLTPISASRSDSWDNVVGHITTESAIQSAIHAADPDLFTEGQLAHTLPRDFILGPWPEPTRGLTAEVRVFGSSGAVYDAYCGASSTTWDHAPVWDFARGLAGSPLRQDLVAGARMGEWDDGAGTFSVTDVDGFSDHGGTALSDQANFVVRLYGSLAHTGHLSVRERDDGYDQMAAWVFTGSDVGTGGPGSELFEIFDFIGNDDETVTETGLPASGDLDIEVIVVWCTNAGATTFSLEGSLVSASGPWLLFGDLPTTPVIDDTLFPPVL